MDKVAADGTVSLRVQYHAESITPSVQGNSYVVHFERKFDLDAQGNFDEVFRTSLISKGSAPNQTIVIHSSFRDGAFVFFVVETFCRG